MKYDKVYITFNTKRETSEFLKSFAHLCGKTQPELINEICEDFIETVKNEIRKIEEESK